MKSNQINESKGQLKIQQTIPNNLLFPAQKSLTNLNIRCKKDNKGLVYCTDCQNYPVMCAEQQCQCHHDHKECLNTKLIKAFNNKLSSSIIKTTLNKQINPIFDKIINQVSQLEQKIENDLKYFGLNQQQKNVFIKIQQHASKQLSGYDIGSIFIQKAKNQIDLTSTDTIDDILDHYKEYINSQKKIIMKYFDQISNKICKQILTKNSQQFTCFQDSLILKSNQERMTMFSMLYEMNTIQNVQKIYTATKNGFHKHKGINGNLLNSQSIAKNKSDKNLIKNGFAQCCYNKSNLLYIVENQYGKKYGGFSPCILNSKNQGIMSIDNSGQSFLFSINIDFKLKLLDKKNAIQNGDRNEQYIVSFGNDQSCSLVITQKSNQQKKYNWIISDGSSYQRMDYTDQQLLGAKQDLYKLKQIQVYQIQFIDQYKNNDNKNQMNQKQEK